MLVLWPAILPRRIGDVDTSFSLYFIEIGVDLNSQLPSVRRRGISIEIQIEHGIVHVWSHGESLRPYFGLLFATDLQKVYTRRSVFISLKSVLI